jgi:hypothetical protein
MTKHAPATNTNRSRPARLSLVWIAFFAAVGFSLFMNSFMFPKFTAGVSWIRGADLARLEDEVLSIINVPIINEQMPPINEQTIKFDLNVDPISEDGIVSKACDFGYRTRKRNDLREGNQVVAGRTVICAMGDGGTMASFFRTIVPNIKVPFTLVTLEHDDSVPHKAEWLELPFLKAWFGWNIRLEHPKLHALPIGLNARTQVGNVLKARKAFQGRKKNGRTFVNFKLDRQERTKLWEASQNWGQFADQLPKDAVSGLEFYDFFSNYTFVLCPRGLGEDTHRLWEALYLGVRPITLRSPISSLYENLPVVQLDKWEDLTEERLREESAQEANFGAMELQLQTWVDRIRNAS